MYCKEEHQKLTKIDAMLIWHGKNYETFNKKVEEVRDNTLYWTIRNANVSVSGIEDITHVVTSLQKYKESQERKENDVLRKGGVK